MQVISDKHKHVIESKYGKKIRYAKDCNNLASAITKSCNEKISPATIMRIFGITKCNTKSRLYTLDLLAKFCGYETWEDFNKFSEFQSSPLENNYDPNPVNENTDSSLNCIAKFNIEIMQDYQIVLTNDTNILSYNIMELNELSDIKNKYILILDNLSNHSTGIIRKV